MKKFIVLLVALCVATAAFGADFSFSWDTDWGWASNFDDTYDAAFGELELAASVDVDEYNTFAVEFEPATKSGTFDLVDADGSIVTANGDETVDVEFANVLQMNSMKITTDLGSYLGLAGVGVEWVNGYTDPGDEEYSDIGNVGHANAGSIVGLTKDWTTDVNLDFGMFWASVAANWNLASDNYIKEMLFLVGSVDAVPGLSVEAGYQMNSLTVGPVTVDVTYLQFDAAYTYDMAPMSVTVAGSYGTMGADADGDSFGAGVDFNYDVDDMTAFNASASFEGNDVESVQAIGGGVGVTYGDFGADVDFDYDMTIDAGDAAMAFVDISGFVSIGEAKFTVGHVVTDYGLDNNSRAAIPTEGGTYFKVTCDF